MSHFFDNSPMMKIIISMTNSHLFLSPKGPGDSLSEKQMLWIDFLNSVGLPSEVCYVKAKK